MNKLNIILIFALIFALQVVYWQKKKVEDVEKQKDLYKQNNYVLINRVKKVYDDKVATDLRIQELEKRAKEDLAFDWNLDISNSPVIRELKK